MGNSKVGKEFLRTKAKKRGSYERERERAIVLNDLLKRVGQVILKKLI